MIDGWPDLRARSANERARFIAAFVVSIALHLMVLMVKGGHPAGKNVRIADAGGTVLEARLMAATALPIPSIATNQPFHTVTLAEEKTMPNTKAGISPVERHSLEHNPAASSSPPISVSSMPSVNTQGQDVLSGVEAGSESPDEIPVLPPMMSANALPRPPSLLAPIQFSYPQNIRLQRGRVRVRILLDTRGQIEGMWVIQAVPTGVFDHAAMSALRKARYAPGYVGSYAMRSYLYLDVTFGQGPEGQKIWYVGNSVAPVNYAAPPKNSD